MASTEIILQKEETRVVIYQQQRMTSIRTQEHGLLAFKLTQTRLGISLMYGKHKNNPTERRDQAL